MSSSVKHRLPKLPKLRLREIRFLGNVEFNHNSPRHGAFHFSIRIEKSVLRQSESPGDQAESTLTGPCSPRLDIP